MKNSFWSAPVLALAFGLSVHMADASEPATYGRMASGLWSGEVAVTVRPGDTLTAISGRYGADLKAVANDNGVDLSVKLRPGQVYRVRYSHLVPEGLSDGITVNVPQRLLFLRQEGRIERIYALGLGRPSWPSPVGSWTIVDRQEGKTWVVPKSIQQEMAREGQRVMKRVPPGPDNPLGRHWLGLSLSGYGIHGTIAPSSLYRFQSHGCMRMHADDIAELFSKVKVGVAGENLYVPVLLAIVPDGRILLEVHKDIYRRKVDALAEVKRLAEQAQLTGRIDWTRVDEVVKAAEGTPLDVRKP